MEEQLEKLTEKVEMLETQLLENEESENEASESDEAQIEQEKNDVVEEFSNVAISQRESKVEIKQGKDQEQILEDD